MAVLFSLMSVAALLFNQCVHPSVLDCGAHRALWSRWISGLHLMQGRLRRRISSQWTGMQSMQFSVLPYLSFAFLDSQISTINCWPIELPRWVFITWKNLHLEEWVRVLTGWGQGHLGTTLRWPMPISSSIIAPAPPIDFNACAQHCQLNQHFQPTL